MSGILRIGEEGVKRLLTVPLSIRLVREAYVLLARKKVLNPGRVVLTVPGGGASFFFMPAYVLGRKWVCVKVVSSRPGTVGGSAPATVATVYLYDAGTGREYAKIAGENLTAIRTAASSAVATMLLARRNVGTLGMFGSGRQAEAHLPAMLGARRFSRVLVYSRKRKHRETFAKRASRVYDVEMIAAHTPREVVAQSDVLVLATSSPRPLFKGSWVRPGTHVNAIGAALPHNREMDTELVRRSVLIVDSMEQALSTYGEILIPIREGAIDVSHVKAELGELLANPGLVKRREGDVTVFKAGGIAAIDAMTADYLASQAQRANSRTR